jgi:hypothetical protein
MSEMAKSPLRVVARRIPADDGFVGPRRANGTVGLPSNLRSALFLETGVTRRV